MEEAFLHLRVEAPGADEMRPIPVDRLDLQAIVEVSQVVSSEIVLEKLIRTLLVVALEHAGAQRGLLILRQGADFRIEAEATIGSEAVQVHARGSGVTSADMPESILRYVTRTQAGVLLDDAAMPNQFLADPYLVQARPRSLLCLTIVKQGNLIGVLYLENNLAPRVFTPDRCALLQLLASQAAISLENARLYEDLTQENRNRRLAERERERINAELQESESRFRGMADATPDVIWITDVHPEKVLYASPSFERIWGRKVEDLYADPRLWTDGIHPEDRSRVSSSFVAWLDGPSDARWGAEFRVVHRDGTIRWIHDRGVFIRNETGGSRRISGISTDITDRREAERALKESESRFALAVAGATDGVWDWDIESGRMFFSERAQVLHGLEPGQTVRQRLEWRELSRLHPEDAPKQKQAVDDYLSGRIATYDGEWRVLHPDGAYRWVRMRGLCLRDAEGRATRMGGSVSDIDAAKRSEAAVKESEERFALAVAGSNHGIWDWDIRSGRMFFSELAQRLFGLEPGISVRHRGEWRRIVKLHPDDACRQVQLLEDYLAGGPPYDGEWRVMDLDGHYRWIRIRGIGVWDDNGNPTRMAGSVTDIDPQKRAEVALLQAQRLEAAGSLAGGIAHDFNNILAAILGYGEMALRDARAGSRLRRDLESIMIAGERGRALVERILAFSRSSVGERVPVHVEEVVREAIDLISATLPAGVAVVNRLRGGSAAVLGDATQIHQVVMNLAINGIQALASGGTLTISLEAIRVPTYRLLTTGGIDPGEYLVLEVTDNGAGIEQAVLDRIFDPFFTTKDPGAGTGLGLSLVHGIVMEIGGAVDVESFFGSGSTFTVYLPRAGDTTDEAAGAIEEPTRGRGQQVLVVDDEPLLVTLMTETLSGLGYAPAGFTSGREALARFSSTPERFAAIITDERMPGISGAALIRAARELRPGIPILMVSGFLGGGLAADVRDAGAADVLTKPVSAAQLAEALARVLHGL